MKMDETSKFMPSMAESETSVLSILFNFPPALDQCENLRPEHFQTEGYGAIFAEMVKQGEGFDVVTIYEALDGNEELEDLNAISQSHNHSSKPISRHIASIISAFKSRRLFHVASEISELSFEKSPIEDRLDRAAQAIGRLQETSDSDEWVDAHAAAIEHLNLIEARERGEIQGMASGIADFDEMLDGGFQRGNLVVIGARPAMGKSALGLTIGLHMARDYSVGFLSMEMPHDDVRDRQTAILGNVSISNIKRPKRGLDFDRVVDAVEQSKLRKFYVSDKGGLNILQVRSKARALKRKKCLDVLIVDYIGLMSGLDSKVSRAYQIEEISRGLKNLAKELEIVVICLAQVNRGAADRGNQVPALHDLRDSGAIEQDADVVAFIHRPILSTPELGQQWNDYAQFRVAKNRQGRCGDVHLFYVADQTRFGGWQGEIPSKAVSKRGDL